MRTDKTAIIAQNKKDRELKSMMEQLLILVQSVSERLDDMESKLPKPKAVKPKE